MVKFIIPIFLSISGVIHCQNQYINSLIFHVEANTVVVSYDLKPTYPGQFYKIQAEFRHFGGVYRPQNQVTGDYGERITGGNAKRFVWNPILENLRALEGEFTLVLQADLYAPRQSPQAKGMEWIEGGILLFGDAFNDGNEDEKPICKVQLTGFFMDAREITFDQYDAFCTATKRPRSPDKDWGRGTRPVVNVTWYDAIEFCNWRSAQDGLKPYYDINKFAKDQHNYNNSDKIKWEVLPVSSSNGYRLPTEAEWEYAAKCRDQKFRFTNGKNKADVKEINFMALPHGDAIANAGIPRQKTMETGQVAPNLLGLYDLNGNVQEWCWDWYDYTWYTTMKNDGGSMIANPRGPETGQYRALRGGSWKSAALSCRNSARNQMRPDLYDTDVGFRCVRNK